MICRRGVFHIFGFLSCVSAILLSISYVTLKKLITSPSDKGERLLSVERAFAIREDLLSLPGTREVSFTSGDGTKLCGLWIERKVPHGTVVVCHGYRGCKEVYHRLPAMFPLYNMLLVDLRAHGQSSGEHTTIGLLEAEDIIAAVAYAKGLGDLVPGPVKLPTYTISVSMGAAATIRALELEPHLCDGAVLEAPYADFEEIMHNVFSKKTGLPTFPFLDIVRGLSTMFIGHDLASMKPIESIRNVQVPLLLMHSCVDDITSPKQALALHKAASKAGVDIDFWFAPPAKHARLHREMRDEYQKRVSAFFTSCTSLDRRVQRLLVANA